MLPQLPNNDSLLGGLSTGRYDAINSSASGATTPSVPSAVVTDSAKNTSMGDDDGEYVVDESAPLMGYRRKKRTSPALSK